MTSAPGRRLGEQGVVHPVSREGRPPLLRLRFLPHAGPGVGVDDVALPAPPPRGSGRSRPSRGRKRRDAIAAGSGSNPSGAGETQIDRVGERRIDPALGDVVSIADPGHLQAVERAAPSRGS